MRNKIEILSKERSRQGLYEFLGEQFEKFKENTSVITVGAGGEVSDLLYEYAADDKFDITTFDINPEREPDILGDFCEYDFGQKSYDYVILSEVLQFFKNPQKGIDNAYKILKPGGQVIITSPFVFPIHDRPYDLYRFTKYGLEYLLNDFTDVKIEEKNSAVEAIDVLWMRFYRMEGKHTYILKRIIIYSRYYLQRPVTKFLMKFIKTDMTTTGYHAVATKPT